MTNQDPFAEFADLVTCDVCHRDYPSAAGICPYHEGIPSTATELRTPLTAFEGRIGGPKVVEMAIAIAMEAWDKAAAIATSPAELYVASDALVYVDNGNAPRWFHDFGHTRKLGACVHIPVARDLPHLTGYLNGGNALGAYHVGTSRELWGHLEWGGWRFPVALSHQYMPIYGTGPWAQGIIDDSSPWCDWTLAPMIRQMRPGEPNGALFSVSGVDAGQQTATGAQLNSIALLIAWNAARDGYPIDGDHVFGHQRVDRRNRCADPPWPTDQRERLLEMVTGLLANDPSVLYDAESLDHPPTPVAIEERVGVLEGYVVGSHHPWLRDLHHQVYDVQRPTLEKLDLQLKFQVENVVHWGRLVQEIEERLRKLEAKT